MVWCLPLDQEVLHSTTCQFILHMLGEIMDIGSLKSVFMMRHKGCRVTFSGLTELVSICKHNDIKPWKRAGWNMIIRLHLPPWSQDGGHIT